MVSTRYTECMAKAADAGVEILGGKTVRGVLRVELSADDFLFLCDPATAAASGDHEEAMRRWRRFHKERLGLGQ